MSDEPMDDILRELRDELNGVRPSPEFAAKVRRQIEAQPARRWFGIWQVVTAGVAITIAAATVVVLQRTDTPIAVVPVPQVARVAPEPRPGVPASDSTAPLRGTTTVPSQKGGTRSAAIVRTTAQAGPEVLVPTDQRMALISLLDGMRKRGTQVPSATEPLVDSEGRLPVPAEIKLSPITIELLGPPIPGGGSRERR